MRFRIIAVGKIKENFLKRVTDDYFSRINRLHRMEVIEVKDSQKEGNFALEEEAGKLLKLIDPWSYTTVLSPEGRQLTTEEMAQKIECLMGKRYRSLDFVIGGHQGLSPTVKQKSNHLLSLSSLTFPYQMTRLILAEQIFRCLKIIRGEKYHR